MTLETLALQGNPCIFGSMASNIGLHIHEIRNVYLKDCFSDFEGVEHRLEYVANVHGIEFINDSKATNVNAAWFALESMNKPVIWIAGGIAGTDSYESLLPLIQGKVKATVFLGKQPSSLKQLLDRTGIPSAEANNMNTAVELAYYSGKTGDIVLLSPGCPSFNLFRDFEDRGRAFKTAVKNL